MATIDSTQSSPPNPAGRGSGRGVQRGRGRVAFLNFGRRQQQVPQEPPREQSQNQHQEEPNAQSDSHSQQSSDRDRRGRPRRRRQARRRGKEGETSPGRVTPVSERGEATAENIDMEATIEGIPRPQLSGEQDQPRQSSLEGTPFHPSVDIAAQESAPLNTRNQQNSAPLSQQSPAVSVNPHAMRDIKEVESPRIPIEVKPSYNNWGDEITTTDKPEEPPTRSQQSGGSRKGKGRERRVEGRTRQQSRQGNLPQGSHILGDAPMGTPPNQRRAPLPPSRGFGGNLTVNVSDKPNSHPPRRAETPDRDHPRNSRVVPTRSFGGQLTKDNSEGNEKLKPDAAPFEPGRPVESLPPHLRAVTNRASAETPKYDQWGPGGSAAQSGSSSQRLVPSFNAPRSAPQANSKNNPGNRGKVKPQHDLKLDGAEDIGTRIHKEIASGAYECMVCYGGLTRKSKVWNCKCCWAVFHLHCVTKWAKQGLEQAPSRTIGADGEPSRRSWRCPACNNPEDQVPDMYTCWCEKTVQPEASRYLSPHSCGQTCGKTRTLPRKCPHACDLQCHAGPCPPCTAIGPVQPCYCGRENSQKRCVDTNYESGWSCENVCDDFMPCGEHTCSKICHPGTCGACEVKSDLKCYCGNEIKSIKCCDRRTPIISLESHDTGVSEWLGYWRCEKKCDRHLDCGIHRCKKDCHPQDVLPAHCPLSPDVITHCSCGKTNLDDILPTPRQSCEDPIPTCDKVCHKILNCGHLCTQMCHDGDCGMCMRLVEIFCRCGKTSSTSLCHQGHEGEPPQCMRPCKTGLNCARHECGERCCAGEKKAMERLVSKKKKPFIGNTNLQNDDGFEPEHICTRPCARVLKCGTHTCPMPCHRGACGTCLEASFEDLSCNCGRTTISAPVPCGARPPACNFPCMREKNCNHPIVPHPCHADEEDCPKCPYLTEKTCLCGKKSVKSVPCWRDGVSCGTECGKKLSCGSHVCHNICHKVGQCDEPCKQQCGKPKSTCGHSCLDACHAPFQCPEDKPCPTKIQLKCACGGLKQDSKCGASKSNPTGNKKELKCTDQCRSRRMALALEIDPEREATPPYSEETIYFYMKDKKFTTTIEAKFRAFAENSTSRRLAFQPMRSPQRMVLHSLAVDFGFESESQDPEPYRSVIILKGPNFTMTPRKTIAEYLASKPSATPAAVPVSIQQLKKSKPVYNSFILKGIRVGLLNLELEKELELVLKDSQLRFNLNWTGNEEVLLEPRPSSLASEQIELELTEMSPKLKRLVAQKGLAETADLCVVGKDGQVVGRQGNQWSMVAANKGAPPTKLVSQGFNMKNGFGIFGGGEASGTVDRQKSSEGLKKKLMLERRKEKEREKEKEEVVDDWETAADDETTPITTNTTITTTESR